MTHRNEENSNKVAQLLHISSICSYEIGWRDRVLSDCCVDVEIISWHWVGWSDICIRSMSHLIVFFLFFFSLFFFSLEESDSSSSSFLSVNLSLHSEKLTHLVLFRSVFHRMRTFYLLVAFFLFPLFQFARVSDLYSKLQVEMKPQIKNE